VDEIQLQHERAVGDRLIDWLNQRDGSHFVYSRRGKDAPDLVYTDTRILGVEIVDAYYDAADAKRQWKGARKAPDAPKRWSGADPDRRLLGDIEWQIRKKCRLAYGPNCILVVSVRPAITSEITMKELLRDLQLPDKIPFIGVYLSGNFPIAFHVPWGRPGGRNASKLTRPSPGGLRIWQLWPPIPPRGKAKSRRSAAR
jgi:hypothetical protein